MSLLDIYETELVLRNISYFRQKWGKSDTLLISLESDVITHFELIEKEGEEYLDVFFVEDKYMSDLKEKTKEFFLQAVVMDNRVGLYLRTSGDYEKTIEFLHYLENFIGES